MHRTKLSVGYAVVLIGAFLWCLSLFVPPLLAVRGTPSSRASHYAYIFFSTICHQYDSRSFHIAGYPLAVCARCSGIYFGFFIGILLVPILRHTKSPKALTLLSIAAIPMLIDVGLGVVSFHEPTTMTRLFTGLFFGILSAIALVPMLETSVTQLLSHISPLQGVRYELET